MKKETYKIQGMHCASCVATIEKVLSKTDGVHSASANFASESALIEFDENKISEASLAKAIDSVGYHLILKEGKGNKMNLPIKEEVIANGNNKTVSMKVLGMDSPHCAMVVEGAIKKLPGIQNTDVDFSNGRAKAVFNPSLVTVNEILKVITDAGYKPIKEEGEAEEILDKEKIEREKQIKTLKRKLIIGSLLSIFIFLGSFPEWFSFTPKILSNNWILFLLTTPVQFWVGSQFYSGLKLLIKYHTSDMNTLVAVGTLAAYFYSLVVTVF